MATVPAKVKYCWKCLACQTVIPSALHSMGFCYFLLSSLALSSSSICASSSCTIRSGTWRNSSSSSSGSLTVNHTPCGRWRCSVSNNMGASVEGRFSICKENIFIVYAIQLAQQRMLCSIKKCQHLENQNCFLFISDSDEDSLQHEGTHRSLQGSVPGQFFHIVRGHNLTLWWNYFVCRSVCELSWLELANCKHHRLNTCIIGLFNKAQILVTVYAI